MTTFSMGTGLLLLAGLLVFAGLLGMRPVAAQTGGGLGALALQDSTTALLGGHLQVRLPEGMLVASRPFDLMGAPEPDEAETRAVLDVDDQRFVVFAQELVRTAPDSLVEAVGQVFAPFRERYGVLEIRETDLGDGRLRAVVVRPETVDRTLEAVPLRWVVVASPDGTVQQIGFYVNPAGAVDLAGADSLAVRMVQSLATAARTVRTDARTLTLARDGASEVQMEIPAGTMYSRREGSDFVVHQIGLLVPLGRAGGGLGVYEGSYPDAPTSGDREETATVLGRAVTWFVTDQPGDEGTVYRADLLMPNPIATGGAFHVFVNAPSPAERQRLMEAFATLRVTG